MSSEPHLSFTSFLPPDVQDEIFQQILDVDLMNAVLGDLHTHPQTVSTELKEHIQELFVHPVTSIRRNFPLSNILSNEEYSGPYNFEVDIHPSSHKNPWVYSELLKKVFMDMVNPFPVDFKIKDRPDYPLYVRITPQYSKPCNAQDFVRRCINHEHVEEKSNKNIDENVRQHILRCTNPEAWYLGEKDTNMRLSVMIPLAIPQTGSDSVREIFQFVCMSTCPVPGINRRPLEIVFTLEDDNQRVLGRKSINVRICRCPKRDKEKEEKEYNKDPTKFPHKAKRVKLQEKGSTSSDTDSVELGHSGDTLNAERLKIKIEKPEKGQSSSSSLSDHIEYPLPNIKIVGRHNYQQVLKYCSDLMSGEILRRPNGTAEPYLQCLQAINTFINLRPDEYRRVDVTNSVPIAAFYL